MSIYNAFVRDYAPPTDEQLEAGGGVTGVMTHLRSRDLARRLCDHCLIDWQRNAIWRALEAHDDLAVGFARLLLWTDPAPLPETERDAWACYMRLWRPGKPHPDAWGKHWAAARAALVV